MPAQTVRRRRNLRNMLKTNKLNLNPARHVFGIVVDQTHGVTFFITSSAVFSYHANTVAIIAGHVHETGYHDGVSIQARFGGLRGICLNASNNIVVVDCINHCIRVVTRRGLVRTLCGISEHGFCNGRAGDARFMNPTDICMSKKRNGILYVSDTGNHCVRSVTPAGDVRTLAGSSSNGFKNGRGELARFHKPTGLALARDEQILLVCDSLNHCIRIVVLSTGVVTLFAGKPHAPRICDGPVTSARFFCPDTIAVTDDDEVVIGDTMNQRVRLLKMSVSSVDTVMPLMHREYDNTQRHVIFSHIVALAVDSKKRHILVSDFARGVYCMQMIETDVAESTLVTDLQTLYASKRLADVCFHVQGERIEAHRCVLSVRNAYFRTLLDPDSAFAEAGKSGKDGYHIEGVVGMSFRAVLYHIYTDKLLLIPDVVDLVAVAHAADMFGEEVLLKKVVLKIRNAMNISNVFVLLVESHKLHVHEVVDACLQFVSRHLKTMRCCAQAQQTFQQLQDHHHLCFLVLQKIMSPDIPTIEIDGEGSCNWWISV
jgi:hypothetical protein